MSAAMRSSGVASTSYRSCPPSSAVRPLPRLQRVGRVKAVKADPQTVQEAKQDLLMLILETRRGSDTTKTLRGQIEEAQVAVEALSGPELQYELLEGKWKLLYTTAADVVSLFSTIMICHSKQMP